MTDFTPIAHIDCLDPYGERQHVDVYAYDSYVRINIDAKDDGIELALSPLMALEVGLVLIEAADRAGLHGVRVES